MQIQAKTNNMKFGQKVKSFIKGGNDWTQKWQFWNFYNLNCYIRAEKYKKSTRPENPKTNSRGGEYKVHEDGNSRSCTKI